MAVELEDGSLLVLLYRAARRRATKEGPTLSDLAREAVARYVNR